MSTKTTKSRKLIALLTMIMAFTMMLGCMTVMAKAKATLENTKMTMGVNQTYTIWMYSKPDGAKYTFKSSKPSVAKVNKNGEVTGVAAGTAKITVTETYKKKSQKVGTVTVTVKKAAIADWVKSDGYNMESMPGYASYWYKQDSPWRFYAEELVNYYNEKATYTFSSGDTKKLQLTKDGKIKDINGTGKVTVTIKETYKKKTVKVGTFKAVLSVAEPKYEGKDEIEVVVGSEFSPKEEFVNLYDYYTYCTKDENFVIEAGEEMTDSDDGFQPGDVLEFEKDEEGWHGWFKAREEGIVYLYYYPMDYKTGTYNTTALAKIKVTVKDYPKAADMKLSKDSIEEDIYYDYGYGTIYVYVNPGLYTGDITVTSTDEKVVTAYFESSYYRDEMEDDPAYRSVGYIEYEAKSAGTAELIVKANGAEKKIKVTVTDSEDEEDY